MPELVCANCGTANVAEARFCIKCGNELPKSCPVCSTQLPQDARFCSNCGHQFAEAESGVPPARGDSQIDRLRQYLPQPLLDKLERAQSQRSMEGERRTVTMLFCDIEGSTAAAESMDPEDWAEIVNGAFEHLINPVYKYEGTLARLMGDAILAFFGAPIAHEDDPQRAVLAGLEILDQIAPYSKEIKAKHGFDLGVRVGINTGLVVVGEVGSDLRVEYTALGDAVNLAARMEQTAQRNTVQISENTYKLIAPVFETESLGEVEVKGKSEPVKTWKVIAAKDKPSSLRGIEGLRAPLIGRDDERSALEGAFESLIGGRGGIVSVMGDAGIGKSRLVAELRDELIDAGKIATPVLAGSGVEAARADAEACWIEGRSFSYESQSAYAAFKSLLAGCFGIDTSDTGAVRYQKASDALDAIAGDRADELRPYLCSLLEIPLEGADAQLIEFADAAVMKSRIVGSVATFLEILARVKPLVVVFEDLHWADQSTLALLQELLPMTERDSVLFVTMFRSNREYSSWRFHEAANRDFEHRYTPIDLKPLGEDESRQLISGLLLIEGLPESLRQLILDRSEGNPFFVEEVIRSLIDSGVVVRDGENWKATREIETVSVPDNLAAVLASRLDRLGDSAKQIALAASVIGREFSYDALAAIASNGANSEARELDESLSELERRGLVREAARLPRRLYRFKHALTQQAAYDSTLLATRRRLHGSVAEFFVEREPGEVHEIARHFLASGEPRSALPYLVAAGRASLLSSATPEASNYFSQALELFDHESDVELGRSAFDGLADALMAMGDVDGALSRIDQMLEMGVVRDDVGTQVAALNKKALTVLVTTGDTEATEAILDDARARANAAGDYKSITDSNRAYCMLYTCQGELEKAREHHSEAMRLGMQIQSDLARAFGMTHDAMNLVLMNRLDEAEPRIAEALEFTESTGQLLYFFESQMLEGLLMMMRGDLVGAMERTVASMEGAARVGAAIPDASAATQASEIALYLGRFIEAERLAESATHLIESEHVTMMFLPAWSNLILARYELGRLDADTAAEMHSRARSTMEQPLGVALGSVAIAQLGFSSLSFGNMEEAREYLESGLATNSAMMNIARAHLWVGLALYHAEVGEIELAKSRAREAEDFLEQNTIEYLRPFAAWGSGVAAMAGENLDEAIEKFSAGAADAHRMSMRPMEARLLAAWADALDRKGEGDVATAKRSEAEGLVRQMGAEIDDAETRELFTRRQLAELGHRAGQEMPA